MPARRTEPTRHLYQGAAYVNAASTDIRKRFDALRDSLTKPTPNVKPIKKARNA